LPHRPSLRGEPRPTTLRDARKLGLLPSVTNILNVIAKPELTAWLQEQAVMAALTLPRNAGRKRRRVRQACGGGFAVDARQRGGLRTAFHHGAERVAQTLEVDAEHPGAEWLRHYRDWYQTNALALRWTEKVLVCQELGYAGTADLLIEHAVHGLALVDLKTMKFPKRTTDHGTVKTEDGGQRTEDGGPMRTGDHGAHGVTRPTRVKPYKSWCYQLAAYREALGNRSSAST